MYFGTLFTFKGRAGRAEYWLIHLMILAAWLFMLLTMYVVMVSGPNAVLFVAPLMLALMIVTFWICLALTIRRLHDRGRSGWWALAYYVIPQLFYHAAGVIGGNAGVALLSIYVLAAFAILIDLGFLKGTAGPNLYGSDPTETTPALPAASQVSVAT
jgi:uncharacterized membrane protein YhaH (DUF805 family)